MAPSFQFFAKKLHRVGPALAACAALGLYAGVSPAQTAAQPEAAAAPRAESARVGGSRQLAYGSPGLAGVPGRLVFSAERLASVSSWGWTIDVTGPTPATSGTIEASGSSIGLLWAAQSRVPGNAIDAINPYGTPRIALDVFVMSNVTLGGSVGYASTSGSVNTTPQTQAQDVKLPTTSAVVLAPRVGVAFSPSEWVSIWLRGGVTYSHCSIEQEANPQSSSTRSLVPTASITWDQAALSLDPMLVLTPFSHFGLAVGPTFDIPLTDSVDATGMTPGTELHLSLSNYGVAGGILGYF